MLNLICNEGGEKYTTRRQLPLTLNKLKKRGGHCSCAVATAATTPTPAPATIAAAAAAPYCSCCHHCYCCWCWCCCSCCCNCCVATVAAPATAVVATGARAGTGAAAHMCVLLLAGPLVHVCPPCACHLFCLSHCKSIISIWLCILYSPCIWIKKTCKTKP